MTSQHTKRYRLGGQGPNPNQAGRPSSGALPVPAGVAGADLLYLWTADQPELNQANGEAMPAIYRGGATTHGAGWEPSRRSVGGTSIVAHNDCGTANNGPVRGFGYNTGWTDNLNLDSNLPYTIYTVATTPDGITGGNAIFGYGSTSTSRMHVIHRDSAGLASGMALTASGGSDSDYSGETYTEDALVGSAFAVTSTTIQAYTNGVSNGTTATTNTSGAIGGTPDAVITAAIIDSSYYVAGIAAIMIVKGEYDAAIDRAFVASFGVGTSAVHPVPDYLNRLADFDPAFIGGGDIYDDSQGNNAFTNSGLDFDTADIVAGAYQISNGTFPYSFGHQSGAYDHSAEVPVTTYLVWDVTAEELAAQNGIFSRYTSNTHSIYAWWETDGEIWIGAEEAGVHSNAKSSGAGVSDGDRVVIALEWTSLTAFRVFVNGKLVTDATVTSRDPGTLGSLAIGFASGTAGRNTTSGVARAIQYSGAYSTEINNWLIAKYLSDKVTEAEPTSLVWNLDALSYPADSASSEEWAPVSGDVAPTVTSTSGSEEFDFDGSTTSLSKASDIPFADHSASLPYTNYFVLTPSSADVAGSNWLYHQALDADNQIHVSVRPTGDIWVTVKEAGAGETEAFNCNLVADETVVCAVEFKSLSDISVWIDGTEYAKTSFSNDPGTAVSFVLGAEEGGTSSLVLDGSLHRAFGLSGNFDPLASKYLERTYVKRILADFDPAYFDLVETSTYEDGSNETDWTSHTASDLKVNDGQGSGPRFEFGGANRSIFKTDGSAIGSDYSADIPFTIYAVVTPSAADLGGNAICSARDPAQTGTHRISCYLHTDGTPRVYTQETGYTVTGSSVPLVEGVRAVLAFEFASLTTTSIYLNGELIAGGAGVSRDPGTLTDFFIGLAISSGSYWEGGMNRLIVVDAAFDNDLNTALIARYLKPALPTHTTPALLAPVPELRRPPDDVLDPADIVFLWDPGHDHLEGYGPSLAAVDMSAAITGTPTVVERADTMALYLDGVDESIGGTLALGNLTDEYTVYAVCEQLDAVGGIVFDFDQTAASTTEYFYGGLLTRDTPNTGSYCGTEEANNPEGYYTGEGTEATVGEITQATWEKSNEGLQAWVNGGTPTNSQTATTQDPQGIDRVRIGRAPGGPYATESYVYYLIAVKGATRDTAIEDWINANWAVGTSP